MGWPPGPSGLHLPLLLEDQRQTYSRTLYCGLLMINPFVAIHKTTGGAQSVAVSRRLSLRAEEKPFREGRRASRLYRRPGAAGRPRDRAAVKPRGDPVFLDLSAVTDCIADLCFTRNVSACVASVKLFQ